MNIPIIKAITAATIYDSVLDSILKNPNNTIKVALAPAIKLIMVIRESHLEPPKKSSVIPNTIKTAQINHLLSLRNFASASYIPQFPAELIDKPLL